MINKRCSSFIKEKQQIKFHFKRKLIEWYDLTKHLRIAQNPVPYCWATFEHENAQLLLAQLNHHVELSTRQDTRHYVNLCKKGPSLSAIAVGIEHVIVFSPSLYLTNRAMPTLLSFPLNLGAHICQNPPPHAHTHTHTHVCYLSKNIYRTQWHLNTTNKILSTFCYSQQIICFSQFLMEVYNLGTVHMIPLLGHSYFWEYSSNFFISFVFTFVCAKNKQNI